jgi:hypothetical protein
MDMTNMESPFENLQGRTPKDPLVWYIFHAEKTVGLQNNLHGKETLGMLFVIQLDFHIMEYTRIGIQ